VNRPGPSADDEAEWRPLTASSYRHRDRHPRPSGKRPRRALRADRHSYEAPPSLHHPPLTVPPRCWRTVSGSLGDYVLAVSSRPSPTVHPNLPARRNIWRTVARMQEGRFRRSILASDLRRRVATARNGRSHPSILCSGDGSSRHCPKEPTFVWQNDEGCHGISPIIMPPHSYLAIGLTNLTVAYGPV
jgi:hypothetical protein